MNNLLTFNLTEIIVLKFLGKKILGNNPNDHIEDLVKFKDNPDTRQLHRWVHGEPQLSFVIFHRNKPSQKFIYIFYVNIQIFTIAAFGKLKHALPNARNGKSNAILFILRVINFGSLFAKK